MPTPSPERIRAILEELYALDPSLREYGNDLEEAVGTLLAAKPDAYVSPEFANALRSRLTHPSAESIHSTSSTLMEKLTKFLIPAGAVAVVAVVVAVVVTQPSLFRPSPGATPSPAGSSLLASGVTVTRTGANAFGDLAAQSGALGGDASAISARSQSGGGYGGGGMAPAIPVADVAASEESANTAMGSAPSAAPVPPMDTKMMIAPDYVYERYRYTYDGELPELTPNVDVYRRIKKPIDGSSVLGSIRNIPLGVVDLNKFGNAGLQQFTLLEPGQYGYQIYVDLNEGMININQNWNNWPRPEAACRDQACFDNLRIKPEDVPSDEALIAIADAFLNERGIAKDAFGAPVVDRRWNQIQPYMRGMPEAELSRMRYIPESVSVTYPVKIEGMTAHDQSGFPFGLGVNVDIRSKRVGSVWNLAAQQYEASSYAGVTDAKEVLDIASRGDLYGGAFGQDPNERIRDLKLGTPERVLMQTWHQTSNGMGEEILVPALRFPVIADADGFTGYREAVVVPLAKDIIAPIYTIMDAGAVMLKGTTTTLPPAVSNPPMGADATPAATEPAPVQQ